MNYIIDVQGFTTSLFTFVFKEVVILPVQTGMDPIVFHFKSPHPWNNLPNNFKVSNRWVARNFHGISWESGKIPYDQLLEKMEEVLIDAEKIYVKGLEKKRWIEKLLPRM